MYQSIENIMWHSTQCLWLKNTLKYLEYLMAFNKKFLAKEYTEVLGMLYGTKQEAST